MIRSAALAIGAACGVTTLAVWGTQAYAQSEIDRLTASVAQRSAMLATERGLIAARARIDREYRLSRTLTAEGARDELIDQLRSMKGITIVRIDFQSEGRHVTLEVSGRYGDVIAAAVGLPARVAGLSIERLVLSGNGEGAAGALARMEGSFS
jgi:hypothetical protein